jgi:hypothetical protein
VALPRLPFLRSRAQALQSFAAIVTIDDGGRAKPAPDLFLTASTRLGVPPRHVWSSKTAGPASMPQERRAWR